MEAPSYVIAAPSHDSEEEIAQWNPVIIAESSTALKRLSVSEAVMELDLTGVPVVVFRHAGHGRVNLVYRRATGISAGLIRRRSSPTAIDGQSTGSYGPRPLRRAILSFPQISGKGPCCSPIWSRPMPSFRR